MAEMNDIRGKEIGKSKKRWVVKKSIVPKATSEAISRSMKSNKSKGTLPELLLTKMVWDAGFRGYRKNDKRIPGKPDIFFPTIKLAILLNGCFWHSCHYCRPSLPKSNTEFWKDKFQKNKSRDSKQQIERKIAGIRSVIVWECQLKKYPYRTLARISKAVNEQRENLGI
jgi:DNA mismatch endonuclease (patch repair protein)